ncbi:MAG: NTP transferase domain-containing protein [Clostridia bacterium]|nr:NTP transferase domain-containing protein [Clostridia bacterium]
MKSIKKAVILTAGLGTRMYPASKVVPKEMFPIVDTPALQFLVDDLIKSGVTEILIVSSKEKTCIQNYFNNNKAQISYIYPNQALGVADAVLHAKNFIQNQPFILLFGDVLFFGKKSSVQQMLDIFNTTGNAIVATNRVPKNQVNLYGCLEYCEILDQKFVVDIKEKPKINKAPSNLVLIGQYILYPQIFKYLEKMQENELFTDCLLKYANKKPLQIAIINGECFDIGSKSGFVLANIYMGLKHKETAKAVKKYLSLK